MFSLLYFIKVLVSQRIVVANIGATTISLPSPMPATLAEVGDSLVKTPIPPQAPLVIAIVTPSTIVNANMEGGSAVEP